MKRAFTLIELLVYLAIMGFIIVVAGRVFSDSTDMRIRSQNLLKSSSEIGKLANLLSEDISQMGVKAWGQITDDGYKVVVHDSVYMDANNSVINRRDSSSYKLIGKARTDSNFYDTLIFRKAVFDSIGKFIAVREITWRRSGDSLFRKCIQVSNACPTPTAYASFCGGTDDDCSDTTDVLIATNVANFKLTPSIPTEQDTLLSENFYLLYNYGGGEKKRPDECENYGQSTLVSGFDQSTPSSKSIYELYLSKQNSSDCGLPISNCQQMTFEKDKTYAIEFEMPIQNVESTQFQPGQDHLSIGLRNNDGSVLSNAPSDALFYPPQESSNNQINEIARHIEFAVKGNITACVAITMAFNSPTVYMGKFLFKNFKVFHRADESFSFPEQGALNYKETYGVEDGSTSQEEKIKEKKSVKAFELILEMKIGREERKSGTFSQKDKGIIISTPNNGVIMRE